MTPKTNVVQLPVRHQKRWLTEEQILKTPIPPAGSPPVYLRCERQVGFGAYITSTGVRTYFVEARVDGEKRPTRRTICKVGVITINDAREIAKKLLRGAAKGEPLSKRAAYEAAHPEATLTLRTAYEKLKADKTSTKQERPWSPRTLEKYEDMLVRLEDWQEREFWHISKSEVAARFVELREEVGALEASLTFKCFRAVWNYHAVDLPLSPRSPTDALSRSGKNLWPKDNHRERTISEDHFPQWWRSLEETCVRLGNGEAWALYFRMLALTGCRMTELIHAEWKWYDVRQQILTLPWQVTKERRVHPLIIGPRLALMLKAHRATQSPGVKFLFARPLSGVRLACPSNVVKRHREKFGEFYKWSCHDLRRTYATVAAKIKAPREVIKSLLNHSRQAGDVTERYIQLEEDVRPWQAKIERAIFERARVPMHT